jgi:photosystem II stability/assembly factor-like uncharacterized protein
MTYPASAGINYWTRIGLEGVRGGVDVLTIDPLTPTTLYAGTHEGLKKSTNGGRNWSYISGAGCGTLCVVLFLAIDPLTPTTLYLGFSDYYAIYLYKSTNGGGNWSHIDTGYMWLTILAIDPLTPTTLYAADGAKVYKSINGGEDWSLANTGLTASKVNSLAIDPLTPTTLYAGTDVAVYKSTNGGGNWSLANTGLTASNVNSLAIDPLTPTTLYTATSSGAYKSTNGGGNWSQMNDIADTEFHVLAVAPTKRASFIYAGTNHGVLEWTSLTSVPTISPWLLLLLDD